MPSSRAPSNRFTPPTEREAARIRAAIDMITPVRRLSQNLPLSYLHAFLWVSLQPGQGATYYAPRVDASQPVMSRVLLQLGNKVGGRPAGEGGYMLIDKGSDPLDLRRDRYFLTDAGRGLLADISSGLAKLETCRCTRNET